MSQPNLDPRLILSSLGISDVESVTRVTGGMDTAIWKVESQGQAYALRVFRPEQQRLEELESHVMQVAAAAGLPVPGVAAVGAWEGRPVMLIAWCQGRTLLAEILRRPWRTFAYGALLGRAHARLHQVAASSLMQEQRGDWLRLIGGCNDPDLEARLRSLPRRREVLLHLDYHPLNVLVEGEQVTGVIDWSTAHAGDPRADVARTVTILLLPPAPTGVPRWVLAPIRRLLVAGYLRGYQQAAGPLADMTLFYAWAGGVMLGEWGYRARQGVIKEEGLLPIKRWVARWKRRIPTA